MRAEVEHGQVCRLSHARLAGKGRSQWTWVQSGVALAALSIFAILTFAPLGVSTQYVVAVGNLLRPFVPEYVASNPYLAKNLAFGWGWMLFLGIPLGAFLADKLSTRGPAVVQPVEKVSRGRLQQAFWGGFLLLFGARLAGGCTSGHIISGWTQMALSSLIFGVAVFAAAIPTALYLKQRRKHA